MRIVIFILCLFCVYFYLVLPSISRIPLDLDGVFIASMIQQLDFYPGISLSRAALGQPPLYLSTLKAAAYLFGWRGTSLRFFGALCFLLNLILIFKLSEAIFKKKNIGILASLFFALHPMTIQGSIILDIDNTILTVILMLICLYYIKNYENFNLKNSFFLTLLFFISLWAKISTPFILISSLIFFHLIKNERRRAIQIFSISIASILIFLIMRAIDLRTSPQYFCCIFDRISEIISKKTQGTYLSIAEELSLRTLRISLWVGLYPILLWIIIICSRIRNRNFRTAHLNSSDLLIVYSVLLFISYVLIGGTTLTFPKYHYPVLPILSIIIANAVLSLNSLNFKKNFIIYLVFGLMSASISYIFSGDLLYQINYILRKIVIFFPEQLADFYKDFAKRILFHFFPFVLSIVIIRLISKKESWLKIFSFLAISFILINNLFINIHQRNIDYFTTFFYGRSIKEFQHVAELCRGIIEKDRNAKIIAPEDVLSYAGISAFVNYKTIWNDRDKFIKLVKDKRVKAILYNFTFNAIFSYKEIFLNSFVQSELKKDFNLVQFREHSVWIRKD